MSRSLNELIMRNEGLRLKPYKCTAGKLTIGFGRNLDDKGITQAEAMILLDRDIADASADAAKYPWFAGLDEVRQAAVIDLMFNLGPTKFARFVKFRQAMQQRKFDWARDELIDSLWHNQVGDRAKRIERMIATGEWPA